MNEFVCAGGAAVLAICVMHPVDVVKTRLQLQDDTAKMKTWDGKLLKYSDKRIYTPSNANLPYRGIIRSLIRMMQVEGVRGLYGGLIPACVLQLTVTGTRFATYQLGKGLLDDINTDLTHNNQITNSGTNNNTKHVQDICLAITAAGLGGFIGTPFYAIKTRMQAYKSTSYQHRHTIGLLNALKDVVTKEGAIGLFRGGQVFVPRVISYGSMQLITYNKVKDYLHAMGHGNATFTHVIASSCAAMIAVTVMQPFDFLAARLTNQPVLNGCPLYYNGVWDCGTKSVMGEGVGVFFKGASANYARMIPYTILVFLFYENIKKVSSVLLRTNGN